VVGVSDDERERRPERSAMTQPSEDLHFVVLDLLPRAAAVALLTPPEIVVDRTAVENEARR
jgi:hypothetical protein